MNAQVESWLSRRKWILVALGLPILVAAWWAFRPEKLWINEKVSEPAPFASNSDPQPRYTGLLEGKAHQTSGRATIYKTSDGKTVSSPDRFHDLQWPGCSRPSGAKQ